MSAERHNDPVSRKARTVRRPSVAAVRSASPAPVQPGSGPARRVDLLAAELGNGRISEAQFRVGRTIQAVFERGSGARLGSADWLALRSAGGAAGHDLAIVVGLEDAERVRRFSDRMAAEVGRAGVQFLRAILAEGHSFKSYAAARGQGSELGIRSVAERFRWLLDVLAERQYTATGPERATIRANID